MAPGSCQFTSGSDDPADKLASASGAGLGEDVFNGPGGCSDNTGTSEVATVGAREQPVEYLGFAAGEAVRAGVDGGSVAGEASSMVTAISAVAVVAGRRCRCGPLAG